MKMNNLKLLCVFLILGSINGDVVLTTEKNRLQRSHLQIRDLAGS